MKKRIYRTSLRKHPLKRSRVRAGEYLVSGLASLIDLRTSTEGKRTQENATQALRGDFVKISTDMRKAASEVIEREKAHYSR